MKRNIDAAIRPEVSGLVSLAILVELLAKLSNLNPEMRRVLSDVLQTAANGMHVVASNHGGHQEEEDLNQATLIIEEIRLSIFGEKEAGSHSRSH